MDKYDIISQLLDTETKARKTIIRLLKSPKQVSEYSTGNLRKARRILGLLNEITDTGFEIIDEWVVDEYKYEKEIEWAEETSSAIPLRELLKRVSANEYKYAAVCEGSKCRPDMRDILEKATNIYTDEVSFIAESMAEMGTEDQKELAEYWFDLVEELDRVNEELEKEIAKTIKGPPYGIAQETARTTQELYEALSLICSIRDYAKGEGLRLASHAGCLMKDLVRKAGGYAEIEGKSYIFLNDTVRLDRIDIEAFKLAEEGLGKKVGFAIPYSKEGDEIKASEVLNDITNFIHEYAGVLFRVKLPMEATVTKEVGRCEIVVGSDKLLEDLCLFWDKAVSHSLGSYMAVDVSPLRGMVFGKRGDFTVGNAVGHKTVFIKEDDTVKVSYYDRDGHIRYAMDRLFSEIAGCTCEDKVEFLECTCKLTNKDDALKLGAILSRATTMDIRYEEAEIREEYETEEELFEKFVDDEKKAVLEIIEKIK